METSQTVVRHKDALRRALGPEILGPLDDPHVVEIMLNPDGALWVDRLGTGMTCTARIDTVRAITIVNTVAAMLETVVTSDNPILECELPLAIAIMLAPRPLSSNLVSALSRACSGVV